ncbi:SpaH/EbpB family LPXTG-anchored major pilin [Enterococcus pingfangensis]|uniref:SpaH/EbpB family LPXTG-anchored major pilin n=1 Tax=Enterococcus pingfangensis TaxID=2559924 RepID=UPI0010F92B6A|nr:SpaH/EbpB family LPXTG-anchored major pilin [Enterococcus pingfangensis]
MKMTKLFGLIATSLIALPLFIGGALGMGEVAEAAAEDPVKVTLHKRVFEGEDYPNSPIQNTGALIDNFGGEALPGVTFTAYDITGYYHAQINNSSQSAVTNAIVANTSAALNDISSSKIEDIVTDSEGLAVFNDLPVTSTYQNVTKDAVYLFVETGTPGSTTVTKKAAPIVLAMPIYGITTNTSGNVTYTDELNKDIHLYPKNLTATDTKEVDYGDTAVPVYDDEEKLLYYTATTADTFDYTLTINIPANIDSLGSFTITDIPTAGLALVAEPTVGSELIEDTDYTFNESGNGFVIGLAPGSTAVKALAGQTLTITYQMKFVDTIDVDDLQNNTAYVSINGTKQPDLITDEVGTGGHKFTKVDSHTGEGLVGAEFVIKNAENKFAKFTELSDGTYKFDGWEDNQPQATTIKSKTGGALNVIGLSNGSYSLIETKAPSDKYVQLTDAVAFTVTHGEYENTALNTEVSNTPKGLLPSTGGNGILLFLAIGLGLMAGAFIWYKKVKRTVEV